MPNINNIKTLFKRKAMGVIRGGLEEWEFAMGGRGSRGTKQLRGQTSEKLNFDG